MTHFVCLVLSTLTHRRMYASRSASCDSTGDPLPERRSGEEFGDTTSSSHGLSRISDDSGREGGSVGGWNGGLSPRRSIASFGDPGEFRRRPCDVMARSGDVDLRRGCEVAGRGWVEVMDWVEGEGRRGLGGRGLRCVDCSCLDLRTGTRAEPGRDMQRRQEWGGRQERERVGRAVRSIYVFLQGR